tara:strand:+ start:68 stop:340 length:273 start_codon:yes stop_codon:yes gene_type:complete
LLNRCSKVLDSNSKVLGGVIHLLPSFSKHFLNITRKLPALDHLVVNMVRWQILLCLDWDKWVASLGNSAQEARLILGGLKDYREDLILAK